MKYAGFVRQSLVDYPGEIAAVLFTRGCNFRCPFCHNPDLLIKPRNPLPHPVDLEEVLEVLAQRRGFLDAVVISGGEPTLHPELPEDIRRIKEMGFLVKLDSNGSNTIMLEQLLSAGLLDYAAMDIKAPLEFKKYQQVCSRLSAEDFFNVRSSIRLLLGAGLSVQFRTTVVPALHRPEDIAEIARYIEGAPLFTLQQFNPKITLDPAYAKVVPYSREVMQEIAAACAPFVQKVQVVNL